MGERLGDTTYTKVALLARARLMAALAAGASDATVAELAFVVAGLKAGTA